MPNYKEIKINVNVSPEMMLGQLIKNMQKKQAENKQQNK